jgi:hypothetical protein
MKDLKSFARRLEPPHRRSAAAKPHQPPRRQRPLAITLSLYILRSEVITAHCSSHTL